MRLRLGRFNTTAQSDWMGGVGRTGAPKRTRTYGVSFEMHS